MINVRHLLQSKDVKLVKESIEQYEVLMDFNISHNIEDKSLIIVRDSLEKHLLELEKIKDENIISKVVDDIVIDCRTNKKSISNQIYISKLHKKEVKITRVVHTFRNFSMRVFFKKVKRWEDQGAIICTKNIFCKNMFLRSLGVKLRVYRLFN